MSKPVSSPAVTLYPSWDTVQAMILAAAIVAGADGHVARSERRSLLRLLSRQGVLSRYSRQATVAAFDAAVREASHLPLDQACVATGAFRSLSGCPGAPLVFRAAAVVALADGVTWPQEIALLEIIRDRVGLRPGGHA